MSFLENAEPWRKNLIVSHMALLAASGVYTLCAWTTEDTCYMVPCYEGVGLETVWKVSQWSTVTAVVAGLYCTIVAGTGFCLFSKYLSEYTGSGDAHLVHGLFAGLTMSTIVVMLNQMGVWSAEWSFVGSLTEVSRKESIFYNNGNHLHLRNGLVAQFQALTVFAVICAALQTVCLYQLYANQHAVGAQVKAAGTADGGLAMEPLLASAKVVQQAAAKVSGSA